MALAIRSLEGNATLDPDKLRQALELLDQVIEQRMQEGLGPGVALALTDRQGLLAERTYGLADVTIKRTVTPETLFEIGSISKSLVAAALLRQCQAGKLDLNAPVTHYLDWFEVQSDFEPITIHHLLSHTAGLPAMVDSVPTSPYVVWSLRDIRTGFAPGAHFHYSNAGYRILGYVLENITGMPYAQALRTELLEPLGLTASEPVITHDIRPRIATGYSETHYDDRPAHANLSPFQTTWFEFDGASGSLACTSGELATFLRMLLNRGRGDRDTFLTEESFALMTKAVIEAYDGYAYGYGLFVGEREEFDGHMILQHGGEMIGYESAMIADLTDGIGVVILVNSFAVPWEEAHFALKLLQSVRHNRELPELPLRKQPKGSVGNAAEYAGAYQSDGRAFELVAEKDSLVMLYGNERILLERWFPDAFFVPHEEFRLSILRFGRAEGSVVEAFHGPDWYRNERYDGSTEFDYPAAWDAYPGHYRTYSPWMSNFRIHIHKGQLVLQWFGMFDEALVALEEDTFRVGQADYSPERLCFNCHADGRALRANLSGSVYVRVSTP